MPALNEGETLGHTLKGLHLSDMEELIIVDGGSTDNSVTIARQFTDKVYSARKGRGHQMNVGAEKAEGDILLFLHADCILPSGGFQMIREVLTDTGVAAGAFDIRIDHSAMRFRIIEAGANLRTRITAIPYGDQGIFMTKRIFEKIGGFADIVLMEDVEISRRLKRAGRIVFVRPPVRTSPRRWLKEGAFYTTVRDWTLALSYSLFNVSPERLIKYYRDIR